MYEAFFGLRERPFQLTPNPRFLFLNPGHREALATLRYGLTSSPGITLLVGEAGTGKTTLLRAALHAEWRPQHRHAVICNPTLAPSDFYDILADILGLHYAGGQKGRFLLAFERDLRSRHESGGTTAIVVDEAQSLSHELFEEIRLLANFETDTAKLVNVVLAGQPELDARLADPSLRQLAQRVVLRSRLAPLDLQATADYISTRLQVAGGVPGEVFTRDAIRTVFHASGGIPRTIGVVCENALLAGFATGRKPVDRPIVVDVCGDFNLPADDDGLPAFAQTTAAPANGSSILKADEAPDPAPRRSRRIPWFRRKERQPRSLFNDY
jgi:general secretion pathway protein A